jgi:hypothetical protein
MHSHNKYSPAPKLSLHAAIRVFPLFIWLCSSCNILEKASLHGFESGHYVMKKGNEKPVRVYVSVEEEKMEVYSITGNEPEKKALISLPLKRSDTLNFDRIRFRKQYADLDITSVLFKYRPGLSGLPPQFTTDFNLALYAGWRMDYFAVQNQRDPLGHYHPKISSRGFDFGVFAGPGTTLISPFTTRGKQGDEYNGMILQGGIAGFLELHLASFGIALGYDYLLNSDREIWIYQNKPWLGFVVGIALN